jgi:hypothetical protein
MGLPGAPLAQHCVAANAEATSLFSTTSGPAEVRVKVARSRIPGVDGLHMPRCASLSD